MLRKFSVSNFKCFKDKFEFDLSSAKNYTFNTDCVKNGIVNCSIVYGYNGSGKSNLGLAIFDIIEHLTDNNRQEFPYKHYTNAYNESDIAEFEYEFSFDDTIVSYGYSKSNYKKIISERFCIDQREVISFDRRDGNTTFVSLLRGTETLNQSISDDSLSVLKYIKNNSVLQNNKENEVFNQFFRFVEHMLFFRSLEDRTYLGQTSGTATLTDEIIREDKVEDFEKFLNEANVQCKLSVIEDGMGNKNIAFDFGSKKLPFIDIMSTGTSSLMLFYYWYLYIQREISFFFIDEFDAFYHHELSKTIIKKIKECGVQFIVTTHNTSIMNNNLMRPDCLFLMNNRKILPLVKCTDKELREAHNIEKIYKANGFYVE